MSSTPVASTPVGPMRFPGVVTGSMIGSVIGVDVGGTKIAAGVVSAHGAVLARMRVSTPRTGQDDVLAAIGALVRALANDVQSSPVALGVAVPGVVDPARGVVLSATDTIPGWSGAPVRAALESASGLPVAVDNDVRAMAYGELARGAARRLRDVLFVSIGTGVGGAMTRGDQLVRGPYGTAGEIAHLLVPEKGIVPCGCGRYDHLEAVASGPAIAARYRAATGDEIDLRGVADRMRLGDGAALAAVTGAATVLGRTLAGFAAAAGIGAVVVGGGAAEIGEPLLDPLRRAFRAEVLPTAAGSPVVAASLGGDGPLIGAALVARAALMGGMARRSRG